jgi:hypothetical protein
MTRTNVHLRNSTRGRWPIARISIMTAALAAATLASTLTASAAKPRIPATSYPAGAHIAYSPSVSNHQLDCTWGFFCEGNVPLFHFQMQDQLHRIGGWAQYAGWRHHRNSMQFALYASHYQTGVDSDANAWSRAAFDDLLLATHAQGYVSLRHVARLLPAQTAGGAIDELQRAGSKDLLVMACWSGSLEVEAIVVFDHGSTTARQMATHYLTQQVQAAMHTT